MKLRTIGLWGRGAKPHFVKLWSGRGSEHDFAEAYALPLICSSLFTPHRWICGLTSNVTRFSEHFGPFSIYLRVLSSTDESTLYYTWVGATTWPGEGPNRHFRTKVPIWSLPRSCTLRCNLVARTHVRHLFGSARFVKRKKAVLLKSSSVSNCKSSQNLKSSRIQLAFHVVFFYTAEVKGFWRNRRKVQMVRIEVINFTSLSQGVCISTSDEFWKPHQCMCRWLTSVIPHRYLMVVRYEFYLRKQASTDAIECCVTKAK